VEGGEVALKFPKPQVATAATYHAAFEREAWVGARVNSPWIGRIIELPPGRQTCLYTVMPLYQGELLSTRLARRPSVGLEEGRNIAIKLARGVAALHGAGNARRGAGQRSDRRLCARRDDVSHVYRRISLRQSRCGKSASPRPGGTARRAAPGFAGLAASGAGAGDRNRPGRTLSRRHGICARNGSRTLARAYGPASAADALRALTVAILARRCRAVGLGADPLA